MKITFTRSHELYGTRYRVGDQVDLSQEAAERLVRDGVARIDAAELTRHLRGRRLRTPATTTSMQLHRGR